MILIALLIGLAAADLQVDEQVLSSPRQLLNLYSQYQSAHPRPNASPAEQRLRLNLFRKSAQFVVEQNRQHEWRSALNKFSDMTDEEARAYEGVNMTATPDMDHIEQEPLRADYNYPAEKLWMENTLNVLDQGNCGSCWIFGSLSTLEGRYHQLSGVLKRFSQQQMLDCVFAWRQDKGCGGGANYCTYSYLKKGQPLVRASEYPAYVAKEGTCKQDKYKNTLIAAKVTGGNFKSLFLIY